MALPRTLAMLNRIGANRVLRPAAPWIPGLGVVRHVGRRSGRRYSTPVTVFRTDRTHYAIPLVYGRDSDWVRNVLAAGHCELRLHGRDVPVTGARLRHDETRSAAPRLARGPLAAVGVSDFLLLDRAPR
jgi:deazaflavin-dependent oxidoreductase (nitroreductase family)